MNRYPYDGATSQLSRSTFQSPIPARVVETLARITIEHVVEPVNRLGIVIGVEDEFLPSADRVKVNMRVIHDVPPVRCRRVCQRRQRGELAQALNEQLP